MSAKTGIAWTDSTWNPVVGCQKVSEGCRNCYALELHQLRHQAYQQGKKMPAQYQHPFGMVQMMPDRLEMPLHWKKPRKIFVNSVSDLFHPAVDFEFINRVFYTMDVANGHTYQVLTKRPERMLAWFEQAGRYKTDFPRNVWMGVSVENQKAADERIPLLVQIPATVKFVSCEPLLGPVDLQLRGRNYGRGDELINWVIAGGESGTHARPMDVTWARYLRAQCQGADVPFFFKQWGEWVHTSQPQAQGKLGKALHRWSDATFSLRVGTQAAGHVLDGLEWRQLPI
jgi:protein gp37